MLKQNKQGNKVFYGWTIVSIVLFANYISIGTGFYIFNAFMEPLCQAKAWSRTDINLGIAGGMLSASIASFCYGMVVTKVGPRILMTVGPFVSGTAFIFLFQANNLLQFTLWCIVLFAANAAFGTLVTGTVVNNWFIEKRGRALGIATIGFSLSGASLPLLAMLILHNTDIITSTRIIGFTIMLVGPLSWIFVRNWPETYGLQPDGKEKKSIANSLDQISLENNDIWTAKRIFLSGNFWKIGAVYICAMMVLTGTMTQLKPRFTSQGFSDLEAMIMMAITALIGVFGKVFWGYMCDKYDPKKVIAFFLASNSLGISFSLIPNSLTATILFILIFGFAVGGASGTYPIVVSYYFGRRSFPIVMKYISLFLMLNLIGLVIDGQSFDRFGSYDPAYIFFMALDFCAIFIMLSVKSPGDRKLVF